MVTTRCGKSLPNDYFLFLAHQVLFLEHLRYFEQQHFYF